jgi:hypothetical protein
MLQSLTLSLSWSISNPVPALYSVDFSAVMKWAIMIWDYNVSYTILIFPTLRFLLSREDGHLELLTLGVLAFCFMFLQVSQKWNTVTYHLHSDNLTLCFHEFVLFYLPTNCANKFKDSVTSLLRKQSYCWVWGYFVRIRVCSKFQTLLCIVNRDSWHFNGTWMFYCWNNDKFSGRRCYAKGWCEKLS